MELTGQILDNGYVLVEDGRRFILPIRGLCAGYPEVLIDARLVGGRGSFVRQSIKPFIGMKVKFLSNNGKNGYNFTIIK